MAPLCGFINVDYHQHVQLLTAEEVAERLGVKRSTVYAYVSRGTLRSHRDATGRRSRFAAAEVEELARRGRPRRTSRSPALDFPVRTALTRIDDHGLTYRGHDALHLATVATFEQVAELLWTGALPGTPPRWPDGEPAGFEHAAHIPGIDAATDRLRLAVVLAGASDPFRSELRPAAVAATGRRLLGAMVAALATPDAGGAPAPEPPRLRLPGSRASLAGTVAGRSWAALAPRRPRSGMVRALNAALVLLADHELATSTLAARVAASARADPYAVVLAGCGPLAGPLHGGASRAAHLMLQAAAGAAGPAGAVADAIATHGRCPGFGHPAHLYPDGDPRAAVLLDALRAAASDTRAMRVVEELLEVASQRLPVPPNIDLALAALTFVADMAPGAGEAIFTVARSAGWIAHALEEYEEPPLRFRARAVGGR